MQQLTTLEWIKDYQQQLEGLLNKEDILKTVDNDLSHYKKDLEHEFSLSLVNSHKTEEIIDNHRHLYLKEELESLIKDPQIAKKNSRYHFVI